MQPRWHDPQPMAMVQHGGRIKLRECPASIEAGERAPAQSKNREQDREGPGTAEDHDVNAL